MDLEHRSTKLRGRDTNVRRALILVTGVCIVPLGLYLILGGSDVLYRYAEIFYVYMLYFPLFYAVTGILCVVVAIRFLRNLDPNTKINKATASVIRVRGNVVFPDRIYIDHISVNRRMPHIYNFIYCL
jgi:hypothetical protein